MVCGWKNKHQSKFEQNREHFIVDSTTQYTDDLSSTIARNLLATKGWIVLRDIPASKPIITAHLSALGRLLPQYRRQTFWLVANQNPGEGTSLGSEDVDFHTELAEFQNPPEYVALYCEKQAQAGGALKLCDLRPLIKSLSSNDLELLMAVEVTVRTEDVIADKYGEFAFTAPILSAEGTNLRIRFDYDFVKDDSPAAAKKFKNQVKQYALDHTIQITQEPGSLVVWDNRFIVHGRTAFLGGERKLWRCCIQQPFCNEGNKDE